jgi:hypothetical protein
MLGGADVEGGRLPGRQASWKKSPSVMFSLPEL